MSRVASSLSESTTITSIGGSWTTRLSSRAEMFLASLRTVATTLTSNAARIGPAVMMVSTFIRAELSLLSTLVYFRVLSYGSHRHDHRHPAGDHQDGAGGQGARRPGPRTCPGALGAALRPDDGPDLLPRLGVAGAGPSVRVEGATAAPAGRHDDATGRSGREARGPRDHPRRHEYDGRGGAPREQTRSSSRACGSGHPIVRQGDARGNQPDRRGPALEPALRADAYVTGQSATRKRDGRCARRREQRDRCTPPEPPDRGEGLEGPLAPRPPAGRVHAPDVPPLGERRLEGTPVAGARRVRASRRRGRDAHPLSDPSADRQAAQGIRPREAGGRANVPAANRADRVPGHVDSREERSPRVDRFRGPARRELFLPSPLRHAAREHGKTGNPGDRIERPRGHGSGARPRCRTAATRRRPDVAESVRGRDDREADRAARVGLSGMTWRPGSSSSARRAPPGSNRASRKRRGPWPEPATTSTPSCGTATARSPRRNAETGSTSIGMR